MTAVLALDSVNVHHGLLHAVRDLTLDVAEGEVLALIGANGAGKSTLLRAIAGANRVTSGRVDFDGADITGVRAHKRVGLGIALVPEGRRLFPDLTVEENLLVARQNGRPGTWDVDAVIDAFPLLRDKRGRRAGNLSGGEQQATAIGRALVTNPRVLLLDEVSLGLAPVAVDAVYESVRKVIEAGTTVVLVEQDLGRALSVASRVAVMLEGRIVLGGAASGLTREQVTDAYFGLREPAGREGGR
jgi:branched-chain amino acid transport system ATP-binding protein